MDAEIIKYLGHEGVLGVALFALGVVLWRIGNRFVEALDRAAARFEANTDRLVDKHGETHDAVARVEAKIDSLRNPTKNGVPHD